MKNSFNNRLLDKCNQMNNRLCIGLDIDPDKLPSHVSDLNSVEDFAKDIIDSTINCYGDTNGIVSVSTVGGHSVYIYSWSNNQPLDTGIVDTAFNLSYGAYALTTEDSLGCSVVDSVYLTEPDLLQWRH